MKPNNPGLSPKAWLRFNQLMARFNLKYGHKYAVKNEPSSK